MRKWKQRLFSLLLCGAMLVSLCVPAEAAEVVDSGDFPGIDGGSPWRWELDRDGVLTIDPGAASSPRPMPDFTPSGSPWYGKADQIEIVVFAYADSVTAIGDNAFKECTSLEEITLPDSVNTIGDSAFMDCTNLTEITLPDRLTTIGDKAFWMCTNLTEITLPDSVTTIGNSAFWGCANLTNITLPDSVTTIGNSAFWGCTNLTEIALPDSVTTIGYGAFEGCVNLTEITLPDSLTTIGRYTFDHCASLTNITLPDSLTTIEFGAFSYCTSLAEITLPDNLTTIGNYAFVNCTDLTITFTGDTPPTISGDTFAGCDIKEIRVPAGAEFVYKQMLSNAGLDLGGGGIELKGAYSITVTATEGGTASASPDFAAEGEAITLTAKPDSGYRFKEWQAESGGVTVDVDSNRFVMPAGAVTVNAVFEKEDEPPSHTHAWAGAWSRNSSHHWHECLAGGCTILSDSGKDGYAAHTPGDWIVDQAATATTAGSRHRDCSTCQYRQTETIPATGGGSSGGGGGGSSAGGSYAPPTYKPDVPQPSEGGSVSVSPSSPKRGDTVTVTPRPDEGYEVDKITVTGPNGKPLEITKKSDGTYTFTQPGGKVKIEVTYKAVQPVETPWNNPFSDVSEGDWYYEAVRFVQERGLMNGYSDGRFGPNDTLSRAQLAQILFNKEGRPDVNGSPDFSDVASEAWYTEAIRWAAGQGIVGGYGNGTFGPNDPITREQLAVMLWRYSGSPAATNKELHFSDEAEISSFALDAMRWAVENGILNGYSDGRLGPQGQATRAQVAQMLKNFIENQEETT